MSKLSSTQILYRKSHVIDAGHLNSEKILAIFKIASYIKNNETTSKLDPLKGKIVTLLLYENHLNHLKTQSALFKVCCKLGMHMSVLRDSRRTGTSNFQDIGKLLSETSDIILSKLSTHVRTKKLAEGSSVPFFNIHNCRYSFMQVLVNLFTLKEHFSDLKGIKMGWIGPTSSAINTYLMVAPLLGMEVKFHCFCAHSGYPKSPAYLLEAKQNCVKMKKAITECRNCKETLKDVKVILTQMHRNTRLTINQSLVSAADEKWVLLHDLPRGGKEIDDKLFCKNNNLSFKSFQNYPWVCGGVIAHCLGITNVDDS